MTQWPTFVSLTLVSVSTAACTSEPPQLELAGVLPGTWTRIADDSDSGDDPYGYQELTEAYSADGKYEANGFVELRDLRSGRTRVYIEGPDHGTWMIEDNRLVIQLTASHITTFRSDLPGFTRDLFEVILADELESADHYEVIRLEDDCIELLDEFGSTHTMIRLAETTED
jgi:hypothetical protein